MAKQYEGSLSLEWYNKQKSILLSAEEDIKLKGDTPAPKINWINKDEALFYEIEETEGKGLTPYWVDRTDIRVKESRPLILQKIYKAIEKDKEGTLPGTTKECTIEESTLDDPEIDNILIKGDNLLALNTLKKMFDNKPEEEKVKCIYIDPPFNTEQAFEYYDDSLAHSEWLTMMRDRLNVAKSLLRIDGIICVHLDDKEVFYCKVLMDEIFGRDKFVNSISVKSSTPSGRKTAHRDTKIIKTKDYILVYKNSDDIKINPQYVLKQNWDTHYSRIVNLNTLEVENLVDVLVSKGIVEAGTSIQDLDSNNKKFKEFYRENKSRIFQTQPSISETAKEYSLSNPDKVIKYNSETGEEYALNGRRLVFLEDSLNILDDNTEDLSILLCDFWDDIDFQNTQNEGGVSFPSSKKPEKLVKRIFSLFTNEGDVVLDMFGGSGTSFSVATKLKRKWIGIEIGNHADTHIVPRLLRVLTGIDQSGISKVLNWQGGGSFKYYHLGESIIKLNEDGTGDFNWKLGRKYLEESFLSSYDYVIDNSLNIEQGFIFENNQVPIIGVQEIGTKSRVAIVSLNAPNENNNFMSYDEIFYLYQKVKKHINPQYINVFTNRGVDIAYDSKPDDLEVIKIPKAIFAELEK